MEMGIESSIMDDIERKQLAWYGYVQRMDGNRLPKQIMEWIPPGKRKRARLRTTWEMGVRKAMNERNLAGEQWNNRREW